MGRASFPVRKQRQENSCGFIRLSTILPGSRLAKARHIRRYSYTNIVQNILQTLQTSCGKNLSHLHGPDFWATRHTRGRHSQHYAYYAKPACYFTAPRTCKFLICFCSSYWTKITNAYQYHLLVRPPQALPCLQLLGTTASIPVSSSHISTLTLISGFFDAGG